MAAEGFTRSLVTTELKQLKEEEIEQMDIGELRLRIKQTVPFGFVSMAPNEIDRLPRAEAVSTLVAARRTARLS